MFGHKCSVCGKESVTREVQVSSEPVGWVDGEWSGSVQTQTERHTYPTHKCEHCGKYYCANHLSDHLRTHK